MALPSEYIELEYIESSGTQYINTGCYATLNTTHIIADIELLSAGPAAFYGTRWRGSRCFDLMITGNNALQLSNDNKFAVIDGDFGPGRYAIDHNGPAATITYESASHSIDSLSTSAVTNNQTLYIFAYNNTGAPAALATMRVYSFKVYSGETLVRDFVPAQSLVGDLAGVVGLYDVVEGKFYTNAGSGAFIAGTDLPDDPAEDEVVLFGMAAINGEALPITGGMAKVNGVVLPITGGMAKINGVVAPIAM